MSLSANLAVMAVLTTNAVILASSANAQTGPSRLQGPATIEERLIQLDRNTLARERFRRKAAETAQKQLEQLADQLRNQLLKEITARKAAERALADLTAQTALADQIDQERQRLREDKVKPLEEKRLQLEKDVADLTRRLQEEARRRQELEKRQVVNSEVSANQPTGSFDRLAERVKELELKLAAAEWARKLAEAQLRLINKRQTRTE